MPKNKKRWIDKKNAVTFHLVHRSQQDPLAADETAPQKVLVPASSVQAKAKKNKEEETKYGIYFDDDYDYLQHLRETNTTVAHLEATPARPVKENNIRLPSSVFASEVEEDVGLLNRAAPKSGLRLDLDPDVVAAMDEDFDFDDPNNLLDDDFVLKANASGDETLSEEDEDYEDMSGEDEDSSRMGGRSEDELEDDLGSLEETKSRFTEFSMSSSVVPRNDQLTLLDDRFEKMFAEYDENEIGPLDCEEIEGDLNPADDLMLRLAEEVYDQRSKVPDPEAGHVVLSDTDSESALEDERLVPLVEKERWDCESILSTYSNLYNHPKLITEPKSRKIRVNPRTGMPAAENRLTAKNLAALGGVEGRGPGSVVSALSSLSIRDKGETMEQKRERKAALRQYRRDRRAERKLNSSAFKEEKKRQEKNMLNTRVNNIAVHF
uniref:Protein LTV1 homolog n=1 Tax=Graphocephala atropunctata TaxID=36148 RepID=A0A1B6KGV9_9HEMI